MEGGTEQRIPYVPALDGIRGVAVAAVLLFHGQVGLPGGFLGVSVFFTLSGYLITTLLIAEHHHTGRVSLARFFARRLRRLLPASLACLAAVTLAGPWWSSAQREQLPGEVWAALANVANWRFALAEHSYADLFRAEPSPLAHYWSLAIEEQLYVLLPLLVVLALRRRPRMLPLVTGGLILASVLATLATRDPDLAYHGTHARAAELLVGSLLAQVGVARRREGRSLRDLVGLAAGAGLVAAMLGAEVASAWLYRGGLLLVALLSAALITAACTGRLVPAALGAAPLVALGRISYGVYLYHWPIFLLLSPERTGRSGWVLLAAQSALTVTIATASFHWLEQPIRRGAVPGRRILVPGLASVAAVALLAAVAVPPPTFTATERLLAEQPDGPMALRPTSSAPYAALVAAVRRSFTPPSRPVVVVVGSDVAAAAALEGLDLQLVDATNPSCPLASGEAARTGTGTIDLRHCAHTASEIERLVARFRADVVVLAAGPLDRAEVRLASQPNFAAAGAWAEIEERWLHVRRDLQAAVDAAASGGAAVVISDAGPPPGLEQDLFDDQVGRIGLGTPTPPTLARGGSGLPMLVMAAVQRRVVALSRTQPPRTVVVVIGRAGTGLDSIDCEAAQERGIALVHAPDANTVATAEHTFALLLALARRVPQADSSLKAGRWDRESLVGFELGGKRLGIVGFGRIGRAVAERARAFAMAVAACDPAVPAAAMAERGVEAMALDRLLPHSEILTLHLPLTPASQGLLSLERLRQLPAGAILVNCARGGLVDEESLLELLDGGHLAGAALDVFEGEPRPWEALLRHPRVLATPHLGSRTHEAQRRVSEEVATAVVRALGLASGEAG